jgi:hypothetical protein
MEKFWGGRRPELIIRGGRKAAPDKLTILKDAPDLQELQALLPGEFMEYRPGAPTEATAKAEKDDGVEPLEPLEEPGSDD